MFCGLKFAILALILGSSITSIVSLVSDYWLVVPSDGLHIGLARGCDKSKNCFKVDVAEHSIYLLIAASIIGFFSLPCSILEVRYAPIGALGSLMFIAFMSFLMALLEFAGLIHAVVVLSFPVPSVYSWSFAVGWIAFFMAVAAGVLSLYVRNVEPADPSPEVQAEGGDQPAPAAIKPINTFLQLFQVKAST
ncbi:uncharacterized protein O3C94_014777 isoform 1-T1 [Discoglossus pictus]